ncbi:MAG: hypothetical protein J6U54_19900 [Clostridiales bacterium]|nr:hypothetical protein [Clostridiales bacterium]
MAFTESNGTGTTMLVQPANGGFGNSGFGNGFGGDGWWILLLFILLGGNNWGNNNGGFGGGSVGGLYPWLNQSDQINNGFQNQMLNTNITSIRDGIFGLSNQLCNSFAQAEIADNARQIADMNQNFAIQTALQNCCCENRASISDLKYTVATENCADRAAISDALRTVIESNTASTQRILDQMCADKIDSKNEKIAELQRELQMAQLASSQRSQTQALLADNALQTAALEQYLAPVPRPAYIVQNPNCCSNYNGCGCGCA